MKSGEVWRYKNWLANLIDSHLADVSEEFPSSFLIRVQIKRLEHDNVVFKDVVVDSEYAMQRATFVEIFEKDWQEKKHDEEEQTDLQMEQDYQEF